MSRRLIVVGSTLVLGGILLHFVPAVFSWFGRLPGDLRLESERGTIFIPLASMLIVSIALTILVNVLRR